MDSPVVRYATALLDLAIEEKKVPEYKEAMKALLLAFKSNPEFSILLSSAFVSDEEKRATLDKLFATPELPFLSSFLKVLVDRGRIRDFQDIAKSFIQVANASLHIEEGVIYSTLLLTPEKISEIERAISLQSRTHVELTNELDADLIGGIKVVIHDRIYDGSIANMLSSLQSQLLKGK
jgi:F-type H+-transporting ATPase subunit delta